MDEDYAHVGEEPQEGQSKKTFVLDLSDLQDIVPENYFVTTGEAIVKLDHMVSEIKELLRKTRSLRKKLVKTKGDSNWLETHWEGAGKLLVKKKDSRSKRKSSDKN